MAVLSRKGRPSAILDNFIPEQSEEYAGDETFTFFFG